jgi:hypothetical protein
MEKCVGNDARWTVERKFNDIKYNEKKRHAERNENSNRQDHTLCSWVITTTREISSICFWSYEMLYLIIYIPSKKC